MCRLGEKMNGTSLIWWKGKDRTCTFVKLSAKQNATIQVFKLVHISRLQPKKVQHRIQMDWKNWKEVFGVL